VATFKSLLVAAAVTLIPAAANAAWFKADVADALDGVTGVGARVIGTAEVRGRTVTAMMLVKCEKNSTTLVFTHDGFVHFSRPAMRYKLDDQQPKVANGVGPSMNNKWMGWWDGAGNSFAKSLYGVKKLKLAILDNLNGEQTVMEFDVDGAQEGLADVAKACKWGK
jgi:hypothetical protein